MKDIKELREILASQPNFRQKQAQQAVFAHIYSDWSQASNFPLVLREQLNLEYPLAIKAMLQASDDDLSRKALIYLEDGEAVETVLLSHRDGRHTVCVSSQVGCQLGCIFCATGQAGFRRNLSAFEIIEQVLYWKRQIHPEGSDVSHLVFMGMGEPFLNYEEVIKAIKLMNQPDYFGLGSRHISVSTSGVVPGIKRFADEDFQVNLAVSLHSANDRKRSELMPIARKLPLAQLIPSIDGYISKTNRKVMLEYMMIKGVNDGSRDAEELCQLIRSMENGRLCFVNLIPYNPTGKFQPSEERDIQAYCRVLDEKGISYTRRYRFGSGIEAACGQLAGKR